MFLDLSPEVLDIIIKDDDQRAITIEFTDAAGLPVDLSTYVLSVDGAAFLRIVPRDPVGGVYDLAILPEAPAYEPYRVLATQASLIHVLMTGKARIT
jgi:hypothetical protein